MTYRTKAQAAADHAAIAGVVDGTDERNDASRRLAEWARTMAAVHGMKSLHCLSDYETNRQAQHLLMAAYGVIERGALGAALIALARTDPSDHEDMMLAYEAIRDAAQDAATDELGRQE